MALRAFRSNPSIGGFGGESGGGVVLLSSGRSNNAAGGANDDAPAHPPTRAGKGRNGDGGASWSAGGEHSCDAFAQIVKELVDNAVDACSQCVRGSSGMDGDGDSNKEESEAGGADTVLERRVRVQIDTVQHRPKRGACGDSGDDVGRKFTHGCESADDNNDGDEVLRVTVSDNGCGMENIEDCVAAFRTSKGSDEAGQSNSRGDDLGGKRSNPEQGHQQKHTAGRYGIGLTLCLLHAQRLVPRSKASITSATPSSTHWTRASYVVDTDSDEVRCVEKETKPKRRKEESGTAVSLLVPGGGAAQRAWPRLAEYLSRFQLSIHLKCSLEVKAPTLSPAPLFIRPPVEMERRAKQIERQRGKVEQLKSCGNTRSVAANHDEDSACWNDGMTFSNFTSDDENNTNGSSSESQNGSLGQVGEPKKGDGSTQNHSTKEKRELQDQRRKLILQGVSSYLKTPVELKNVAHSMQPIRTREKNKVESENDGDGGRMRNQKGLSIPMLEVDVIVYKPKEMSEDVDEVELETGDEFEDMFLQKRNARRDEYTPVQSETLGSTAQLMLIRMVNRIPLLDSAEAEACGVVRELSNQTIWNSFGIDVSSSSSHNALQDTARSSTPDLHIPTYSIKDSVQVAPFFQSSTHSLFELDEDHQSDSDASDFGSDCSKSDGNTGCSNEKRKRKKRTRLLPAGLRLGNVLVITQIHAEPSSLPLPTLSKGRLPLNNKGIVDALQVGLSSCLRSLQRTNPGLLLTTHQLKETERDVRYIPAVAASLASIISNSKNGNFQRLLMDKIVKWESGAESGGNGEVEQAAPQVTPDQPSEDVSVSSLGRSSILVASGVARSTASAHCASPSQKAILRVNKLGPIIEDAIRFSITEGAKAKKRIEIQKKKQRSTSEHACKGEESQIGDKTLKAGTDYIKSSDGEASVNLDDILTCQQVPREKKQGAAKVGGGSECLLAQSSNRKRSFREESSFSSFCESVVRDATVMKRQSFSSLSSNESERKDQKFQAAQETLGSEHAIDDDDWW